MRSRFRLRNGVTGMWESTHIPYQNQVCSRMLIRWPGSSRTCPSGQVTRWPYAAQSAIYANVPRLDNSGNGPLERLDVYRIASLVMICLLLAISTASQISKQHFNLGMTIDEFAKRFDLDRPDALSAHAAVRSALKGERSSIQILTGATKMAFLFDECTLREVEITTGNTFKHELQAMTEPLGEPTISKMNLAVWDRRDGTRFTLTSRRGSAVLLVSPTPAESE